MAATGVILNGAPYAFTENRYGPLTVQQANGVRIYHRTWWPELDQLMARTRERVGDR